MVDCFLSTQDFLGSIPELGWGMFRAGNTAVGNSAGLVCVHHSGKRKTRKWEKEREEDEEKEKEDDEEEREGGGEEEKEKKEEGEEGEREEGEEED